jgi:CheY-like chemotaxis protein
MSDPKLSVLVADDSSTIHAFFRELAERSPIPFEIVRAEEGRQCLELLNSGCINLAFIDVNMPEMSGMEAVGVVRLGGSKTFVTLMSSNASDRRRQLARQLKVYEFLCKPFTAEDVLRVLRIYRRVTIPTKALIVDDSATVRRIVRSVFTSSVFNIDVTEAGSGQAALECCASGEVRHHFPRLQHAGHRWAGDAPADDEAGFRRQGRNDDERAQRGQAALGAWKRRHRLPLQAVLRIHGRSRTARPVRLGDAVARPQ